MTNPQPTEVSQLLAAWGDGDRGALERLIPLVYGELRRLASNYLRKERRGHTLQTSALVHEAYLKLVNQDDAHWQNRAHFFGVAAQIMRRILVDHARTRARLKRGGYSTKLSFNETLAVSREKALEYLMVDDALTALAEKDPTKSRIVELKIFCGLTNEEIAEVEKVSLSTVEREWRKAKAWLHRKFVTEGSVTNTDGP
jgi:RNA polymerase sigma factor (TIGR02999 family)